jgi:VWFA-related protein
MVRLRRFAIALILTFLAGISVTQEKSAPQQTGGQSTSDPAIQAQPAPAATVLKFTTRLVVVDVIADHQGHPVTDLKQQDFSLIEDGKEQSIKVFSFQSPETAASAAPAKAPELPANVFTNVRHFDPTKVLNVLLLDALNTKTVNQVSAKEQMLKFLEKLPADQPVAVYAMGSKLLQLQDFTTDPALLKTAVKEFSAKHSPVLDRQASGTGLSEMPAGAAQEMMARAGVLDQMRFFQQENLALEMDQRVALTLNALNALAGSLAGYPGRKNLVWLSESFPLAVLADNSTGAGDPGVNFRNYAGAFDRTASLLTDAQVAIYPVDIGNLVSDAVYAGLSNTDSSGEYIGRTATGRSGTGSTLSRRQAYGKELDQTSQDQFNAHSTMNELANRTGGKAFYNRNDVLNSINKSIDDGSTYYTLGYYPDNKDWNGQFRKVQVKVNRSGVKLRYRLGYFATDPQAYAKLDAHERGVDFGKALSLDIPASTALPFQARVSLPSEETKNKLIIHYAVDPHALNFELQSDGLQHAAVDCAVGVYTRKGEPVGIHGNSTLTAAKTDQVAKIMQGTFPCQAQFDIAPGDYIFRLGVRDPHSGLMGTTNAQVTVPASRSGEAKPSSNP